MVFLSSLTQAVIRDGGLEAFIYMTCRSQSVTGRATYNISKSSRADKISDL